MRQNVDISILEKDKNYELWFMMNNFLEGYDEEQDLSLMEIMEDNYEIDKEQIELFTQYSEGIFESICSCIIVNCLDE